MNADCRGYRKMKKIIYLILFCALCVPIFWDSAFSAETGAAFLKIGVGARPLGMGGGYIAIADDVNAIYWNPGGLAQLRKKEISAMHTEWIDDIKYEFVGYAVPLTRIDTNTRIKNLGTLAFSIGYLRMGEMERRDENRKLLPETFTAYDLAGTISYSKFVNPKTSIGINLKIIQQKIEEETANGFAFDLGLLHKLQVAGYKLQVAGVIQNLGPQMKFINEGYNLPLTISAGLAYKIFSVCNLGLNVTHRVFEKRTEFGFGTEYWFLNTIALRGRYNFLNSNDKLSSISKFGFGLGFKLSEVITSYQIDYSFLPYADLGNTHRISFSINF